MSSGNPCTRLLPAEFWMPGLQMIEELSMGVLMSVAFAIPTYYFCELQGSFFVVWLVWLVSLADGIGEAPAEPHS